MIADKFFCASCKKDVDFLSISTASRMATICRATIYYWMERGWIHWSELPNGRRVVCQESLLAHRAVAALSTRNRGIGR
jgi:hypothetical protein